MSGFRKRNGTSKGGVTRYRGGLGSKMPWRRTSENEVSLPKILCIKRRWLLKGNRAQAIQVYGVARPSREGQEDWNDWRGRGGGGVIGDPLSQQLRTPFPPPLEGRATHVKVYRIAIRCCVTLQPRKLTRPRLPCPSQLTAFHPSLPPPFLPQVFPPKFPGDVAEKRRHF